MQIWICKYCGKQFVIEKEGDEEYLESAIQHIMSHAKDPEFIGRFFKVEEDKRRQDRSSEN